MCHDKIEKTSALTRRSVLLGGGALVVSIGAAVSPDMLLSHRLTRKAQKPPNTRPIIVLHRDQCRRQRHRLFGKPWPKASHRYWTDGGGGTRRAVQGRHGHYGQMALSVNQGGASGSTGIQFGGKQMRMAAAEARRVLVEMAAARFSVPAKLIVTDGIVSAIDTDLKRVSLGLSYAELIGGKYFNVQLDWNKKIGNELLPPAIKPKKPSEYKIDGQRIPRDDIAPKVFCQENFVSDMKVPGMVHGRMIRPPVAGSVPVKVDDSAIKGFPGAKTVWEKGFLGVVADNEWDAIQAAEKLKVEWSAVQPPFPDQASLYDHIRQAPVRHRVVEKENGNIDEAFRTAARVIEAEYEMRSSHMPAWDRAARVVDVQADKATVWTGSPKPHFCRDGVAAILSVPAEKVEGISMRSRRSLRTQ